MGREGSDRERERDGDRDRDRESQAGSTLSIEPDVGLEPTNHEIVT